MSKQDWRGRCLTCRFWTGCRAEMFDKLEKFGDIVMDDKKGWPTDATCTQQHEYSEILIDGDANAEITFDANHGCRRWVSAAPEYDKKERGEE